jgi:hypothetical protein
MMERLPDFNVEVFELLSSLSSFFSGPFELFCRELEGAFISRQLLLPDHDDFVL